MPPLVTLALAFASLVAVSAAGQTQKPRAPAAADAMFDVQKSAFLALPLETRKAVQDALVWLGLYNGSSDGEFGKRTRDSIVGWQASQSHAGDGFLSPKEIEALMAAAKKARAAVGFEAIPDAKTGARIGAPKTLMSGAGGAKLEFASSADGDLAALYARLSAAAPTRKIAYKAMKPGAFFVVSGQDGAAKFYARYEMDATATPPIRGFVFSYPAMRAAELDRIAIAVANSFEAFPAKPAPAASAAAAPAPPAPALESSVPAPRATALIVGRGQALSALKPEDCPSPSIEGKPARLVRTDAATGLVIFTGDFGSDREGPRLGAPSSDLVVLSRSGGRTTATSAVFAFDAPSPAILAGLARDASGAPAFNRQGELAGVVASIADEPKRVATVALIAPHPIIGVEALRSFLAADPPESARDGVSKSAGAIAADEKDAIMAVSCAK